LKFFKGRKEKKKKTKKNKNKNEKVLEKGKFSPKDYFAPSGFDLSDPAYIKVGDKYVKSFIVKGFPSRVSIGWLDNLYNYDGDMDTALYIEPADERTALDELTNKITQYEAQLYKEQESGSNKHITRLQNNINQLYAQREKLEQNYENLFHIQIISNLYTDSEHDLKKETQLLDNKLTGKKINLMPSYLRQDISYKSALPFGKNFLSDGYRNFNSGALTSCFPFYNSEISHKNGVFFGVNMSTMTPAFIDFYDRSLLANSNLTVFGKSGYGKTFFVSLLTLRSALKGIRTVIIDPEGEYAEVTKSTGGSMIQISPESKTKINPFDLEEEEETDDEGKPTGEKVVRIKDKVSDILNLIAVMAGGLSREQESLVSIIISKLYEDMGFNTNPESLYVTEPEFNQKTGEFYHQGKKRDMPTFSDFHKALMDFSETEKIPSLKTLGNSLKMFKKGEVYGMFDCQTSSNIDFKNSPVITFDISQLEESILRPIGMYIALTWTWEKFIKKNPEDKKRIVVDEAWMFVSDKMSGYEYTSAFLDKSARRIRKRNGGLLVASQNFVEFENNEQGKAVLTNASMNVFLRQDSSDIDGVKETFKLSQGESAFLLTARRGEMLLRMGEESSVAFALAFDNEKAIIDPPKETK
jgi:type IV secretory pathway VirB4 component